MAIIDVSFSVSIYYKVDDEDWELAGTLQGPTIGQVERFIEHELVINRKAKRFKLKLVSTSPVFEVDNIGIVWKGMRVK